MKCKKKLNLCPVQVSTVWDLSTITAARFWCNAELPFFREERKGLTGISSVDAKISWYLLFSTPCKQALARDVAVKPIVDALVN